MTNLYQPKRVLLALATVVVVSAAVFGLTRSYDGSSPHRPVYEYPALFTAPPPCFHGARPAPRAASVERQGHFHAERYPYDPRDGIEAVIRFQEAQSCYEDAKLLEHARRAAERAADLIERINTDYASSRLVLENALASEKWVVALNEIHLLLRLTEHVRDHVYVDYLSSIVGKVTIRANAAP